VQRVEVAGALTAEENRLAVKILNGETKGIKFNIDRIIFSESTDQNKMMNEGGGNKNITHKKVGRRRRCGKRAMAGALHGQRSSVSNDDLRGGRGDGGHHTRVTHHVG
jgi:hypothetical protein